MKRLIQHRQKRRWRQLQRRAWVHAVGCVVCAAAVCDEFRRDLTRGRRGHRERVARERPAPVPVSVVEILEGTTSIIPIRPARLMLSKSALVWLQPSIHRGGLWARAGEP